MEASLTCAVCLCLFEEPVTLPLCSHNFCKRCVLECTAPGFDRQSPCALVRETQVSCPLCRKVSVVAGGASNLPVNTTLAEVVKLSKPEHGGAGGSDAEAPGLKGSACPKHPGRSLQLFCKMCRQVACGQCVAEEHKGFFHAINLIDIVYQEEKLMFFTNLKKLREMDGRLMKEISSVHSNDEGISKDINGMITTQFDEIYRILDLKKKQLLKEFENWSSKKIKEQQVWKQMKDSHKKTTANFLKDCEEIVDECDPQCFLKVACDLNTRMKTQLDLITMASCYKETPNLKQTEIDIDIKPILDAISDLNLTGDLNFFTDPFAEKNKETNGRFVFKDSVKQWKEPKDAVFDNYCPVLGEEETLLDGLRIYSRYMSVSAMTRFKAMSHEELRQKYYETYRQVSTDCKTQTLAKDDSGKSTTTQFGLSNIHTTLKSRKEGRRLKSFKIIRQSAFDEVSNINPERKTLDLHSTFTIGRHNEKKSQKMDGIAANSENNFPLKDHVESTPTTPSTVSGITQTQSGSLSRGVAASPLTTSNPSTVKEVYCSTPPPAFCFKKVESSDKSVLQGFVFGKSDNENNANGSAATSLNCLSAACTVPVSSSFTFGISEESKHFATTKANVLSKISPFSFVFNQPDKAATSLNCSSAACTVPVSSSFAFGISEESKHFATTKANGLLKVSPFSFVFSQPDKATEFQTSKETTENVIRKPDDLIRTKLPAIELCEQTAASARTCTASKSTVKEKTDISDTLPLSATNIFSFSLNNCVQKPKSTQTFSFVHGVQNVPSSVTTAVNTHSEIKPNGMAQSVGEQLILPHTVAVTGPSTFPFTSLGKLPVEVATGGTIAQNNSAACNTLFSCLFPSETSHFSSSSSTAAFSVSHTRDDGIAAKNSKTQGDLREFLRQQYGLESSSHVSDDLISTTHGQPSGNSADKMEAMSILPAVLFDLDCSDDETSHSSSIISESNDPNNEERISFNCTTKSINFIRK